MKHKLLLLGLVALVATATLGAVASTATAQPPTYTAVSNITQAQSGGILSGTFSITDFTVNEANQLVANGVFTGTALVGGVPTQVTSAASAPVTSQQVGQTCEILDLILGPLHLDLLGLVVDLNQVHLTITAERGPGNLLGNLLCAVAGLLDSPAAGGNVLDRLLDLINRLLGA